MRIGIVFITALISACSSSLNPGDPVTVSGFLYSMISDMPLPSQATPLIQVYGRDSTEFPVSYETISGATRVTLQRLPMGEDVIFEILGSGFDPSATLPIKVEEAQELELGALSAGSVDLLVRKAEREIAGLSVNRTTQSTILGMVEPRGPGCAYEKVDLVDSPDPENQVILSNSERGPFYFDSYSSLRNSGAFQDAQCSYVIFNLLPGKYWLRFTGPEVIHISFIAIPGRVLTGYNIPR